MSNRKRKEEDTVPHIARRLRLLRAALGISQAEISRELEITRTSWNNYETEFGRINIDTALRLVRRYHVTLDWIYLGNTAFMPHGLMKKLAEAEASGAADRAA